MEQVIDIIKKIKSISGTNDKINFLSQFQDNEMLKDVLNIVYNPRISTKLSDKKIIKDLPKIENEFTDEEFIHFISTECSGKDIDIQIAQAYINKFREDKDIVKEIITQKLSIGIDYKNINKAFGYQFIEFYEPMLAYNVEKVLDKIGETEVYTTIKLDGTRALIVCYGDGIRKGFSRNGLELEGYEDFLSQLELDNGYIYDGELLYSDDSMKSDERFRKTSEITRTKGKKDKDLLVFNIFDIIPINEFEEGVSKLTYRERREQLDRLKENKYQKVVKILHRGKFNNTLFSLLDEVVEDGQEGLMLNTADGLYEVGKRSKNILKMKKFHDVDVLCIGVEEGTGKHRGKLGSILVEYFGYEVKVGSGFTDEQRDYFWKNKDEIIDQIVKVKYFEESSDMDGNISLRFPVFVSLRLDKKEISYD